jgi:long-chain acyl-CoA synthetase
VEGEVYMSLGTMPNFTYHNSPQARDDIDLGGFVTSGDIGYLDEQGYLYLCDRKRDMVISGGVNIYPAEIEAVLCGHPAVIDAAVFGIPDSEFGERLMGVVQLHPGEQANAQDLREFALARLASYKVPREIKFAAELPRDASGKIYKRRLRDPYWEAVGRRI